MPESTRLIDVTEDGHGNRTVERTLSDSSSVTLDLGFQPNTSGHVLVLLRNGAGEVVSAYGVPLPPGDFAAG